LIHARERAESKGKKIDDDARPRGPKGQGRTCRVRLRFRSASPLAAETSLLLMSLAGSLRTTTSSPPSSTMSTFTPTPTNTSHLQTRRAPARRLTTLTARLRLRRLEECSVEAPFVVPSALLHASISIEESTADTERTVWPCLCALCSLLRST
jgi:hypothetical protein